MKMPKSLYIHIPFCRSRCPYCGFMSCLYEGGLAESFLSVLLKQIKNLNFSFRTIYIGGGTPTVLDINLIEKLLMEIKRLVNPTTEFTIEANPESLSEDKIKLFLDCGINRISIGCQSFNNKKLNFLGRIHTTKQAEISIQKAKKSGFDNISLDLIFGLPGEINQIWQADLFRAAELPITHLSTYMLTYEKETQLFRRLNQKEFLPLPEEKMASMYKEAIGYLTENKFKQYEISNFAKKGFNCFHNFSYWRNESYLGLGPSAVSFLGKTRKKNVSSLAKYINAVRKNEEIWDYSEELSGLKSAEETAALKIRTLEGINLEWFKEKTGFNLKELKRESLADLFKEGLIEYSINREALILSKKGVLFADTVSAAFL